MKKLIGRKKELALLKSLKDVPGSTFVAVYGRRRVGKTFLIREAYGNYFNFQVTGMANVNLIQQLANFNAALRRCFPSTEDDIAADSWFNAFERLALLLEKEDHGKKYIFIDEMPWMDTPRSNFISALEHFWNSWAGARDDITLIVCGSAAGWMVNTLINNTGGLHNRVTHRIKLNPFNLNETEKFLVDKGGVFERYQIVQLYMAMGGIPFYLDQVEVGMSADQNVNQLFFDPAGLLHNEFNNLYKSLFNDAENHIAVIKVLSQKNKGLTRQELLKETKMPSGGVINRILNELEECGFIRKYIAYGKKGKNSLYQLADSYSLFYMKWIKGFSMLDENAWINELGSPVQNTWAGYAFEQICFAHIGQIKHALGISGVQTVTSSWVGTGPEKGAQIDLVIDRRDQVVNICEMKFSIHDFTITKKYASELRNKINVFKQQTKTNKAINITFITTFGVAKNKYYGSLVQNDLTMDIFFADSA